MRERPCIAVYLMSNRKHGTIYIGVSSDLAKRVHEHRTDAVAGFTRAYRLHRLVWYEIYESMMEAIHREKRLKKYTRAAKVRLVEQKNPEWHDLWETIL